MESKEPNLLYAPRLTVLQGHYYVMHVKAMTDELLHSKSAIAGELAHRDILIQQLKFHILAMGKEIPELKKVQKIGGSFQHTGTVVAEFHTTELAPRIVVEFDAPVNGMLHIYRPDQVTELVKT